MQTIFLFYPVISIWPIGSVNEIMAPSTKWRIHTLNSSYISLSLYNVCMRRLISWNHFVFFDIVNIFYALHWYRRRRSMKKLCPLSFVLFTRQEVFLPLCKSSCIWSFVFVSIWLVKCCYLSFMVQLWHIYIFTREIAPGN